MASKQEILLNKKAWAVDLFLQACAWVCAKRAEEHQRTKESTRTNFMHWRKVCNDAGVALDTCVYSIKEVLHIMSEKIPQLEIYHQAESDWKQVRAAIRRKFSNMIPRQDHVVEAACEKLTYANITSTLLWAELRFPSSMLSTIQSNLHH